MPILLANDRVRHQVAIVLEQNQGELYGKGQIALICHALASHSLAIEQANKVSLQTLARECFMSNATLKRWLPEAEALGYVTYVSGLRKPHRKEQECNVYQLGPKFGVSRRADYVGHTEAQIEPLSATEAQYEPGNIYVSMEGQERSIRVDALGAQSEPLSKIDRFRRRMAEDTSGVPA
jgi:hypothetical protein